MIVINDPVAFLDELDDSEQLLYTSASESLGIEVTEAYQLNTPLMKLRTTIKEWGRSVRSSVTMVDKPQDCDYHFTINGSSSTYCEGTADFIDTLTELMRIQFEEHLNDTFGSLDQYSFEIEIEDSVPTDTIVEYGYSLRQFIHRVHLTENESLDLFVTLSIPDEDILYLQTLFMYNLKRCLESIELIRAIIGNRKTIERLQQSAAGCGGIVIDAKLLSRYYEGISPLRGN